MTTEDTTAISFDHVAIAVRHMTDPWPLFADVLGGTYHDRGISPGFGWTQMRFAHGFVVEGLHPEQTDQADFLTRFLQRHGPGPHHLTFMVPSLDTMLERARTAGFSPIGEDRSDPAWMEAFLHPSEAHGIVVQLAQLGESPVPTPPEPEGYPETTFDRSIASIGRVVHAVADLDGALRLYRDLLGGRVMSSGAAIDGNHWVELGWSGHGRLRLLEGAHAEIAAWIGGRPGRLRHLFFNFDEPAQVPGARKVAENRWVVEADEVLGTRLVIASNARP
ncbi:MAG: VOC family protein [Actinobacteria bacterium]|nr:VOC family protein [Actinomycetota bacterium]